MKRILEVLLDASVTLQEIHHELAVDGVSLTEPFNREDIAEVVRQLSEVLVLIDNEKAASAPVKEKKETLDEFIQRVADSFEFAHDSVKNMWVLSLTKAIETLEHKRGYAACIVPLADGTMLDGKLNVNSSYISLKVDGIDEFIFEKSDDDSVEDDADYEEAEENWEEEESPCEACDCVSFCQDEMTFLEYIKERESLNGDLTLKNLELIEYHLEGKKEFSADDYELLRYFLKANPQASSHEVDTLSEYGLRLAWNARLYIAGKL